MTLQDVTPNLNNCVDAVYYEGTQFGSYCNLFDAGDQCPLSDITVTLNLDIVVSQFCPCFGGDGESVVNEWNLSASATVTYNRVPYNGDPSNYADNEFSIVRQCCGGQLQFASNALLDGSLPIFAPSPIPKFTATGSVPFDSSNSIAATDQAICGVVDATCTKNNTANPGLIFTGSGGGVGGYNGVILRADFNSLIPDICADITNGGSGIDYSQMLVQYTDPFDVTPETLEEYTNPITMNVTVSNPQTCPPPSPASQCCFTSFTASGTITIN
jgi:hypothetical protein